MTTAQTRERSLLAGTDVSEELRAYLEAAKSPGADAAGADAGNSGLRQVEVEVLPDGTLKRPAAAAFLGVRPATLARWAVRGCGPPFFRLSKFTYYRLADLQAFKARHSVERLPRQEDLL